jgi:AcrR family transcriptional regulator
MDSSSAKLTAMATGQTRKRRRRTATLDHNAEMWAHIEPESSRLLLLSALDAFLARGFHAATTREIGERAGMSPAAVYVHWKAKHDLLFEISRTGHQAVLDVVEQALEQASDDPVERVYSFVSAFATWHAENHALARVIQYEFKKLPRRQFRQIVEIRDRFEELMRNELAGGAAADVFDVEEADLEGTTLAVLSLCIDLARWYEPSPAHSSATAVGELYAGLVIRMLRPSDEPEGAN